jgi:hypothetical protein
VSAPDIIWKYGKFGQTSRRDAWWLSPSSNLSGFWADVHDSGDPGGLPEFLKLGGLLQQPHPQFRTALLSAVHDQCGDERSAVLMRGNYVPA